MFDHTFLLLVPTRTQSTDFISLYVDKTINISKKNICIIYCLLSLTIITIIYPSDFFYWHTNNKYVYSLSMYILLVSQKENKVTFL